MIKWIKNIYRTTDLLEWAIWSLVYLLLIIIPLAALYAYLYVRPLIEGFHPERIGYF